MWVELVVFALLPWASLDVLLSLLPVLVCCSVGPPKEAVNRLVCNRGTTCQVVLQIVDGTRVVCTADSNQARSSVSLHHLEHMYKGQRPGVDIRAATVQTYRQPARTAGTAVTYQQQLRPSARAL
eukprot:GHRR01028645.1.p1 GENE.GHRR01028645.1~~GHRR01028645.1.p1  ORF type:complete len:125 (-),score=18.67 GHRR01028645.1:299-673(-)